jgi:hypothetical protein
MSDVIVILGMHRSGTSAVAGVLTKLGGAAPKHPMPPSERNARGYFESLPLMRFHDELLASAGSYWHDWRRFNPNWYASPAVIPFKKRARELFEQEFSDAPLAVLKDPRMCRFAPFWIDLLKEIETAPRMVIPIRSPLEVARSLKKRDAMSITKGLLLWLRHVLDAEMHTRAYPRCIFAWDLFLSDWRRVCDKISSDTGLSWPRLSDRSGYEIEKFLSAELINNKTSHAELVAHSDVHEWTVGAYEALLELARNPFLNSARERLDEIRELFEKSSAMFGRVLVDYEIGLDDLRTQVGAYRGDNERLLAQQNEIKAELAAIIGERERLANELHSSQDRLAEVTTRLAAEDLKLNQFEIQVVELTRERGQLTNALAGRTSEVAVAADEKQRLLAELEARRQEIGEMTALLMDHSGRLEQANVLLAESSKEKESLSSDIAARIAELDVLREERDRFFAELQAREQTLREAANVRASVVSRAEHAEAQLVAITSEREVAVEKNRELAAALEQARAKMEKIEAACDLTTSERDRLAINLDQMWIELRRMENEAANRLTIGTALSSTLVKAKNRLETPIRILSGRLADIEAAPAISRVIKTELVKWSNKLPLAKGSRRLERKLIRSRLFDVDWYKSKYKDVDESGLSPAMHYLETGYLRGYRPNPFFDTHWYMERYEDVRRSGMNPLIHYILHGCREGRDPGPEFQTNFYLLTYPDVRLRGINPLAHYLHYGRAEGRLPVRPAKICERNECGPK